MAKNNPTAMQCLQVDEMKGTTDCGPAVERKKEKRNRRKEKPKKLRLSDPDVDVMIEKIETVTLCANVELARVTSVPDCSSLTIVNGGNLNNDIAADIRPKQKKVQKKQVNEQCNVPLIEEKLVAKTDLKAGEQKAKHRRQAPKHEVENHKCASNLPQNEIQDHKCDSGLPKIEVRKHKRASKLSKIEAQNHKCPTKSPEKEIQNQRRSSEPLRNEILNRKGASGKGHRANVKEGSSQRKSFPGSEENRFDEYIPRDFVLKLLENPSFIKGFLRINQRNFREAYINSPDGGKDILIDGVKERNRALEGDEVVIQLFPESQWKQHEGTTQKTGRVVNILTPLHNRQAVGTLKPLQSHNTQALFSPRDSRIPRIRIPLKECPKDLNACSDQLYWARISGWNDVRFALGSLLGDTLGVQGDIEAETRAIMLENELSCEPYSKEMQEFFPKPPYKITAKDFEGREDLRKKCIFTIDPLTARDLDDAMSCEILPNGNYMIGVHISDVSFFLREGTPLDKAVAQRATTTYLVQTVFHMLPRELTMMCSLLPGEDKCAFSVFWEMTPNAEVVSHRFTRSVIHSCAQLAYEHAQVMIDDPLHEWKDGELPVIHDGWTAQDLVSVVTTLHNLALIMRKGRFESGALRIDQPKLTFSLDSSGLPATCATYVNKESHRLIEEFMLLANITVASTLLKSYPNLAFLRCHDPPLPDMLQRLRANLLRVGVDLDITSAGALHKSLERSLGVDADKAFALNSLVSRPMTRARYFCAGTASDPDQMQHYALNVPLYTHFTSPIRRYADVMVHRLLAAHLGYSPEPEWTIQAVQSIAANCNKQKQNAKKAGEQSSELFFALWVGERGPFMEKAIVIDVKDHSFDALVCSFGTNVRVYTDKLAAVVDYSNKDLAQLDITWGVEPGTEHGSTLKLPQRQVITMFSVVTLELGQSTTNRLKLEATLQRPPASG